MNLDENLSIYNDGNLLSIDSRSAAKSSDYIQLFLDRYRAKNYTLRIKTSELPGFELQLRDKYTNTLTALTKNQETEYSFSVSSDLESKRIDRFALEMNFPNEVKLQNKKFDGDQVKIYPNPVKDELITVTLPYSFVNQSCNLKILDMNGRIVWEDTKRISNPNWDIPLEGVFSNGIFLIQVSSENDVLYNRLIIQNH
jgi:hypothetical protein